MMHKPTTLILMFCFILSGTFCYANGMVGWYNSETGLPYNVYNVYNSPATVLINGAGRKVVSFEFPSFIRDLQNQTINNTFGDAVFVLTKKHVFD